MGTQRLVDTKWAALDDAPEEVVRMTNILCLVGRHDWQHRVNKEMGGPDAGYDLCSRCGKEKKAYGKPPSKGVATGF